MAKKEKVVKETKAIETPEITTTEVKIVGLSGAKHLVAGTEYTVGAEVAKNLIAKGWAKLA
jgi:hypothetical protein